MKQQINKTTLLIIGALFFTILGAGLGAVYENIDKAPQIEKSRNMEKTIKIFSSEMFLTATAYGTVANIDGKNITLNNYLGESLIIPIEDGAQIFKSSSGVPQKAGFGDIKIDDYLSVGLRVLEDGALEGKTVMIKDKL